MSKMIWAGVCIGSIVGGYIPMLWGADMLSMEGVVGSVAGGIVGVFAGYKVAQKLGM